MRFHSVNHHKSSGIEQLASDLSALEYIIYFKKRNPKVFNCIVIGFIVIMLLCAFLLLRPRIKNYLLNNPSETIRQTESVPISLNSSTVVEQNVLTLNVTVHVPMEKLVLMFEYFNDDEEIILTEYTEFNDLPTGTYDLTVNTNSNIDLFSHVVRTSVI